MYQILDFLETGLLNFNGWQIALVTFIGLQVTLSGTSLFLHREQTHRGVILHPALRHFYRFWTWLTTGMLTKEWVAIHRKHHAHCETELDPHSPQIHGIKKVLFHGVQLYTKERKNQATMDKYGVGTPNDWLERNIYSRFHYYGIVLLALIDIALFGVIGLLVFAIQALWIPIAAAGIINGVGHFWGYRNYKTEDTSRNITRFGFLIMGEELHNNHHAFPSSCKFSHKKGEFDVGWGLIKVFEFLGLAEVKKTLPELQSDSHKSDIDSETVKALLTHKFNVLQLYIKDVISPTVVEEYQSASKLIRKKIRQYIKLLSFENRFTHQQLKTKMFQSIEDNKTIQSLIAYKNELRSIWDNKSFNTEEMIEALRQWCSKAEKSGHQALQQFAVRLRSYRLQPITTA